MFATTPAFSGYSVNYIDAAFAFYGDTLGLPVTRTPEGIRMNLFGGTTVFLCEKSDHAPATFTVLNFQTDSIDLMVDQMTTAGIMLENYDMGPMKADEKGIYRGKASGHGPDIAWFKDPAGNILSVIEG